MALKVRNRVGLAAGAAALGLTVAALSVSVVSPAEAVANRRLCVYSYTYDDFVGNASDLSKVVFVNYKKAGECPEVDVNRFNNVVGMEVTGRQPVPKIVCEGGEAFLMTDPKEADRFEKAATVKGIDLCRYMDVDVVYRVTWSKHDGIRLAEVGPVLDYAPWPTG